MLHDVDSTVFFRPTPDRRQTPDRRTQWRGGRREWDFSLAIRDLAARILAEYAEQPGLKLTLSEATRLFAVDMSICSGVLEFLAQRGPLLKTSTGHFMHQHPRAHVRPESTQPDVMPAQKRV